jgi:CRISPR/Cas system CSM-associated protein Csm2 small subunit
MNENITPIHDQLRQALDEQTKKPSRHPLMKQIDEWEQASIEKVHLAANDARKQLSNVISKHATEMEETLELLAQQLKKARDDDHFFETDLKEWMNQLDVLEKDLATPQTINIRYDNNTTSFISKILIEKTRDTSDDCFEQSVGYIQITNNSKVITHNQRNMYASVCGRREYSSGEHRLRFVIENLSSWKCFLFWNCV